MTRLLGWLVASLPPRRDGGGEHPPPTPYSCRYVAGLTARRVGERPLCGEDSALVRPYLVEHERRQRARRRTVWFAVRGVDIGHRWNRTGEWGG
ncbi:hypothetical protein [Streptomyces peucetius]|uniref:Secreted protein n=1 Tax=Streptomyces peucetius TaxID=1950 RepID=A0ABY6I5K4_STRPE|nr:hypothetical protein [Streptomyces peucetius]UYQ62198.1 hypothetical protein OGH68_12365 [Streptomyces peucetius]